MGGIGKTALAQLIYNDERVDQCFQLKAWVWASQQFDVARIIKDLLEKINASTCRTKEPDESLMEAVEGKKLLLVLDDAWNIEYNEWDKLLLPLIKQWNNATVENVCCSQKLKVCVYCIRVL
ncbi:putative disease resistance protein RGA3 [Populus alba]|uniref:putative disease resistance protein RGA3 n=1 Tax=Populus alba TaxID=43335 RepID=UPI00158A4D9B|nr:putative disease resistance protein RGA3 [Populus alba]